MKRIALILALFSANAFGAGPCFWGQGPSANCKPIRLSELPANGVNYVEIRAADSIAANFTLYLPVDDGTSGQGLSTDGSGVLSWVNFLVDPMTTRGDMIYRNSSNVTARLPVGAANSVLTADGTDAAWSTTPVAGSFTANALSGNGFFNAATAATIVAVPSVGINYGASATGNSPVFASQNGRKLTLDMTAMGGADRQLTVPGATGTIALNPMTANGDIIYGTNSGATSTRLAPSTATTVLHSGTVPSWSAIDVTTDITGVLPLANGGCNKNQTATAGAVVWLDADSCEKSAAGSTGQMLHSGGTGTPTWAAVDLASSTETTGTLPLARGGTNGTDAAVNGGLVWSNATGYKITSAGTASDWVLSGGAGTPTMSSTTTTAKVIDGSADAIQLTVQGNATQTSDIGVFEKSDGTDLVRILNTGKVNLGGATDLEINANTSDASDTSAIFMDGGGASSASRGAVVGTYGNEYGSSKGGRLELIAGSKTDSAGANTAIDFKASTTADGATASKMTIAGNGGVNISETTGGTGNVPHNCTRRSGSTATTTTRTISCNSGERVMGGGCDISVTATTLTCTYPSSDTAWLCCTTASTTITAYAICCTY